MDISKDREQVIKWVNNCDCAWVLILLADWIDKKYWGEFIIHTERGVVSRVGQHRIIKKGEIVKP